MALKIRLARGGSKKRPHYSIVVSDSRMPRDGRFIEQIGLYDPSKPDADARVDQDRMAYWVGVGAQVSPRVLKVSRAAAGAQAQA